MADLVLGLAKSAVEGTLTMAKSAMEEEQKLQRSVQRDLMLISDEFEMMNSFLNVTQKRVMDDVVKTVVRQVRNMALDVEDSIESVVHLDNKSHWWRRMLPSCVPAAAPVIALDEAVAGMELLKARVEAMGLRNMRYSHLGDPSSQPITQMQHLSVPNSTADDILVKARDAANKLHGRKDLIELIGKKDAAIPLQVISVWGSGGDLGTKSIIKEAYDDKEICEKFKFRAWVKLMHPFNPHEFIRSLIAQFYTSCCQQQGSTVDVLKPIEVMVARGDGLIKKFMKQVGNERYLVILEDISTMDDWDSIMAYLPGNYNGSCIVVRNQQLEIASLCIGHSYRVSELERFSDYHSVCVFFKEDREKGTKTIKEKAAEVWSEKFGHLRVGREIDLDILLRGPVHATDREMFLVWGIAGVGKSYIVKHMYCSEMHRSPCNFDKFGWVNVSRPFDLKDLSRSLLLDLHSDSLQHGSMLRIKDPIQECCDLLHEHKCLVVIDGLQSAEEWNLIKAALLLGATESPPNSRIIVITNEGSVATCCSTTTLNVKGLEVDEALDLFKRKVLEKTDGHRNLDPTVKVLEKTHGHRNLDPTVIEQAKRILPMCGGLPRVIVAIAEFYVTSNTTGNEDWMMLNDSFMHKLETKQAFGSLRGLFAWLQAYFHNCPDFLKPCIFYLSIFPVSQIIRRRRLVRRWIAEGYARDTKESIAEDISEEFFSKLVKLSMIQMTRSTVLASYVRMSLCQVNGFFCEYIISRSMEENLVLTLEGHCSMNSQRTGRHLAIQRTWDRDINVFESIDFSRLRSLTVFGEWRSFFISDKMRLLRVLDLENTSGVKDGDLELMVKWLPRLKFLSMRGCKAVTCLPDSLGGLRQLQTLDIRDTSVISLPKSIIKLQKLQYIRTGTTGQTGIDDSLPGTAESQSLSMPSMCRPHATLVSRLCVCHRPVRSHNGCVKVPEGIQRLKALHTLGVIDVSVTRGKATLKELKNLTQLRKLGVSGINLNNSHEFFCTISGHCHLESLSVQLDSDNEGCLDGSYLYLQNLRSIKLYGLVDRLPIWFGLLRNLRKLTLQMITMSKGGIDPLRDLPNLAVLYLHLKEFQEGELQFSGGLSGIHVLKIACNPRLHVVTFPDLGFNSLEALKLHCSNASSPQLSGLKNLQNLKEVWLSGSYRITLKEYLHRQLAEHGSDIKPVLREEPRSS